MSLAYAAPFKSRRIRAKKQNRTTPVVAVKGNISDRDYDLLVNACENAPEPNAALIKAVKDYCAR